MFANVSGGLGYRFRGMEWFLGSGGGAKRKREKRDG